VQRINDLWHSNPRRPLVNSNAQPTLCRVAVIQYPPVYLNLSASTDKACTLVKEAASQGADLAVFPETWLPGYPVWLDYAPRAALWDYKPAKALYRTLVENSITLPGSRPSQRGDRHFRRLLALARETGIILVMGANERLGGTLYNSMITFGADGQSFQVHRKLVPTYSERLVWGRGDGSTLSVFPTRYGNVGGLICWEHWMPLARAAMHAKGETIHVAQWPAVKDLHQLASRHYAFEGQCFVVAAGSVLSRGGFLKDLRSLDPCPEDVLELLDSIPGEDEDLLLSGGSAVIGPHSRYIAGPLFDQTAILYADIDLARITEGHLVLDTQGHYSRPDIFTLQVDDRPQTNVHFQSRGQSWTPQGPNLESEA
jgi:predicted amidohydrolase